MLKSCHVSFQLKPVMVWVETSCSGLDFAFVLQFGGKWFSSNQSGLFGFTRKTV